MNENFEEYIGNVEKAQETSTDIGMHKSVCMHVPLVYYMSECVLKCKDTPTLHCGTTSYLYTYGDSYIHLIVLWQ